MRSHAQDFILEHFRTLVKKRQAVYAAHMARMRARSFHYFHAEPHPSEIALGDTQLKHGVNNDWKVSLQLYPEVIDYFFSVVGVTVPDDDEPAVRNPILGIQHGEPKIKKMKRSRRPPGARSMISSSGSVASAQFSDASTLYEHPLLGSIREEAIQPSPSNPLKLNASALYETYLRPRKRDDPYAKGAAPPQPPLTQDPMPVYPLRLKEPYIENDRGAPPYATATVEKEPLRPARRPSVMERSKADATMSPKEPSDWASSAEQDASRNNTASRERHRNDQSPTWLSQDDGSPMEEDEDELAGSEFSWSNSSDEAPDVDKSHPLFQLQREYLNVVIKAYDEAQNDGCHIEPASTGVASASSILPNRGRETANRGASRKHGRSTDAASEGGEKVGSRASNKRRVLAHTLVFACPFVKKDPMRHRDCYRYFLTRIRDVKQHIKRCHRMPIHCARCTEIFSDEEDRDEHLRSADCSVRPLVQLDGVSEKQQKLLSQRISSTMSEDEQWFAIFDILFPGHNPRPKTPYLNQELSEQMQMFRDFLATQGPALLSDFLGTRATITWDVPPGEGDLAAFQETALADGLLLVLDRFILASAATEPSASNSLASGSVLLSTDSGIDMHMTRGKAAAPDPGSGDTSEACPNTSVETLDSSGPKSTGESSSILAASHPGRLGRGIAGLYPSYEPSPRLRGKEKNQPQQSDHALVPPDEDVPGDEFWYDTFGEDPVATTRSDDSAQSELATASFDFHPYWAPDDEHGPA